MVAEEITKEYCALWHVCFQFTGNYSYWTRNICSSNRRHAAPSTISANEFQNVVLWFHQ
jgi:hypothetical protein